MMRSFRAARMGVSVPLVGYTEPRDKHSALLWSVNVCKDFRAMQYLHGKSNTSVLWHRI